MDSQDKCRFIASTKGWLQEVVLGLNLCPFARKPVEQGHVRFEVCHDRDAQDILTCLVEECVLLDEDSHIETTLLILTNAYRDFLAYNDFLSLCEGLLFEQGFEGRYQLASFHPDYRFADAPSDCVSNWTNRSPYPILHILREDRLERAISAYGAISDIPERNIRKMKSLTKSEKLSLFPYLSP